MHNFKELGLSNYLIKALDEIGFQQPTEIQGIAIPILVEEEVDMVALAQTGTGKTAAFGLPLLQVLELKEDFTQALIVAPTRELTQQIMTELKNFSKFMPQVRVAAVYGGTAIGPQLKSLRQNVPHIIVATPGRLIDMIDRNVVKLGNVSTVVLDEADEMLNMGFQQDITKILSFTPNFTNTWLFSATMAPAIRKIASDYMKNPVELKVSRKEVVNRNIEHRYSVIDNRDRTKALIRFIDRAEDMYGLIFCRTKRETQKLADELASFGYRSEALHGDLSQSQRDLVMKKFRSKAINLLIATDVAARGIDVDELTHVFHYSLPDDIEYYTHRSGRTARAGKSGISHTLLRPSEGRKIKDLEKKLNISFEEDKVPTTNEIRDQKIKTWVENLLTKVNEHSSKSSKKNLTDLVLMFEGLEKEDILNYLIAKELNQLTNDRSGDLNANLKAGGRERSDSRGGRDRDRGKGRERERSRDRGDRADRSKGRERGAPSGRNEKFTPYFMNVGKVDGVSKTEIIEFVRAQAGIRGKELGTVQMSEKHTIVEIDSSIKDFAAHFRNITINDRDLRVKKDQKRG